MIDKVASKVRSGSIGDGGGDGCVGVGTTSRHLGERGNGGFHEPLQIELNDGGDLHRCVIDCMANALGPAD